MWAAELITFLSIFLVITLTRFALKNEKHDVAETWLQIWAEFLQQPINFTYVFGSFFPAGQISTVLIKLFSTSELTVINYSFRTKHTPEVILGIFTFFTCLLVANAYSGGLSSIMTVPRYEAPIDTAHQLGERNMEWGGIHTELLMIAFVKNDDFISSFFLSQGTHIAWTFSIADATEVKFNHKIIFVFPHRDCLDETKTIKIFFSLDY